MPPNEAGACESLQEGVRVCVGLSLFLCSLSLSLSLSFWRAAAAASYACVSALFSALLPASSV